jgi:hypothetical protein
LGGFPPKGAPLTGCENNDPKNLTAARGIETALVRVAVLRPLQETVFRFSTGHADSAFAVPRQNE